MRTLLSILLLAGLGLAQERIRIVYTDSQGVDSVAVIKSAAVLDILKQYVAETKTCVEQVCTPTYPNPAEAVKGFAINVYDRLTEQGKVPAPLQSDADKAKAEKDAYVAKLKAALAAARAEK